MPKRSICIGSEKKTARLIARRRPHEHLFHPRCRWNAGAGRSWRRGAWDHRKTLYGGRITKRIIAAVLALLLLTTTAHAERITERKSIEDEAWLWDELSQYSPSDVVTAGVLSYFWRESQYRSDAVAGWGMSLAGYGVDLCETVTAKTDAGLSDGSSRYWFIKKARRHGGYGLGQWYRTSYVEDLYDFAREWGTSIGDAEMQCAFVFHSIKQNKKLWKKLKRCKDPEKAGRLVSIYYDGSQTAANYIGYKAAKLYGKYTD